MQLAILIPTSSSSVPPCWRFCVPRGRLAEFDAKERQPRLRAMERVEQDIYRISRWGTPVQVEEERKPYLSGSSRDFLSSFGAGLK